MANKLKAQEANLRAAIEGYIQEALKAGESNEDIQMEMVSLIAETAQANGLEAVPFEPC